MSVRVRAFVLVILVAGVGCGWGCQPHPASSPSTRATDGLSNFPFTDVTTAAGIRFRHDHGGTSPLNILQTAGSGCAFLDYDGDGLLDIYLVNGRYLDNRPEGSQPHNALYHNNGDGTFTDVTERAGVGGTGYGMGCAVADFDGDGRPDIYVTNYGRNTLYRNNGDGSFKDVTLAAGVGADGWSTCAAWADYNGDGWLDLFVGRYVAFSPRDRQLCEMRGISLSCPPRYYDGQSGILYRNNGNGTFTDVTGEAGVANSGGKALGALWWDYDGDGKPDLFVANDGVANNLYHNLGGGRFKDEALLQGVAYGANGHAQASMGVDAADYNGDGRLDLWVTNFQNESRALYQGGKFGFVDAAGRAGLVTPSLPFLSFGTAFLDYDGDTWPDLIVASGHVQDLVHRVDGACMYAQARQLFRNQGNGTFQDLSASAGPAFTTPAVGRGLAVGDFDNDGDLDVLINNNGGAPMLLRNEVGNRNAWLRLKLEGRPPNRAAIGARVEAAVPGLSRKLIGEVRAGSSYCSTSDPRPLFGLGSAKGPVTVTVRWPDGKRTTHGNLPVNKESTLREP